MAVNADGHVPVQCSRITSRQANRPSLVSVKGLSVVLACAVPLQVAVGGTTYDYDALGRVISARQDDGKQTVYVYDAAGNRVQTVVSGSTLNRVPVAVPDAVTLYESQSTISVDPTRNDSDPDGTALSLYSVTDGTYGTATRSANTLTYTTSRHRNGSDTIIYTITDGQGQSASGRVTVTLANLPPVAVPDTIESPTSFGRLFDPRINDTDPGQDELQVLSFTQPSHGSADFAPDGSGIIYSPAAGYLGADAFSYTIGDGDGGTATAMVNVNVVPNTPPPPVAVPDVVTLTAPQTGGDLLSAILDPRLNDSNPLGSLLQIIAVTQPSGGIAEIIDNGTRIRITAIGGLSVASVGPFTYTVADGLGRQSAGTVTPTISPN